MNLPVANSAYLPVKSRKFNASTTRPTKTNDLKNIISKYQLDSFAAM